MLTILVFSSAHFASGIPGSLSAHWCFFTDEVDVIISVPSSPAFEWNYYHHPGRSLRSISSLEPRQSLKSLTIV